jgi:predicted alpha/beta superfamily hydrolase
MKRFLQECLPNLRFLIPSIFSTHVNAQPVYPAVTLPNTEIRTIKSKNTGRTYEIYIRLPNNYAQNPSLKYPSVFVLDGQWDFKLIDSVVGGLLFDQFVPEMFIVGISYAGENPNYEALRLMDDTSVPLEGVPGSGDAPKFLAFFKDELIPFISSNYRTHDAQRILLGSSAGGLFTLYAMFEAPLLFNGYIAASPAVSISDNVTFKQEAQYASQHQDLPVKLFIGAGELEGFAQPVQEFCDIVRSRGYSGLKMESRIIEGERHAGNKPEAYNRGLRFIFQGE